MTGGEDVLAKLFLVGREDADAFATTGNGDVPLLGIRGGATAGVRDQDVVDRFALGFYGIQFLEGLPEIPTCGGLDGGSLLGNGFGFLLGLGQVGVLTLDTSQFHRFDSGMTFDGDQCIRGFHRPMLAGVPGQDHSSIPFLGQREEIEHLSASDLSGFIDNDGRSLGKLLLEEEHGDGGRLWEPSLFHLDHLLSLRSQDHYRATAGHDLVNQLTKDKTLPRSSTTPEHGDGMGRPEELPQGFSLAGIESGIEWGSRSDVGMEGADTVASEAGDVLLPVDDLGHGYGTRELGVSQVAS